MSYRKHAPIKWIQCAVCGKTCPKRGRIGVLCMSRVCESKRALMRQKATRAGMSVETLALHCKARTVKEQMRRARSTPPATPLPRP